MEIIGPRLKKKNNLHSWGHNNLVNYTIFNKNHGHYWGQDLKYLVCTLGATKISKI